LIGTAVAMALFGRENAVQAQAATAATTPDQSPLQEVVVTGIRYSLEKSLEEKRTANSVIDVVTAEDIGKMPDKNIADSLQRVPGITISSAGASEGGFDENDRVSMRGTNPSLTQTLINGHNVAAGDWFVLNQTSTVGRSVSYTLLPSELVSSIVVHKSSEADLVEGGVAGSIDIITRRALDITKPFTFEADVGAVYADQPRKGDPQASALVNWHNDASNFGVLVQGFYEERHLERQGVELLGYDTINSLSAMALAHPDLSGVQYPTDIGAALFTQKRTRKGGLADVEWKPTDNLSLDLSGFLSNLDAPNYNRNFLMWDTHFINSGAGQAPDPGYVVTNGTLTKATFTGVKGTYYGVYDQISRPNESESSNYINLDTNYKLTSSLSFLLQLGISKGTGKTPTQDVSETVPDQGGGASYQLNGIGNGPNFTFLNTDVTTPNGGPDNPGSPPGFGWIFGAQNVAVYDKEDWGKLDGLYNVNGGSWTDLKFGLRLEDHDRSSLGAIAQGPTGGSNPATYPQGYSNYPGNFENFGGNIPMGMWYWTPAQLAAYNSPENVNRDPITRAYIPNGWYTLHEKNQAAYLQGDFKGDGWSGNLGVRVVRTHEDVDVYAQDSSVTATTPGAVLTSAFGPYVARPVEHSYTDVLPTANLKLDLSPTLIARFAAGKTMTRADYSAIGGNTSLGAPPVGTTPGSGSSGNPDLKPVVSLNLDAGLEWYFTRRSLLSATAFYMDLENYIGYGSKPLTEFSFSHDFPQGQDLNYILTTPVNAKGRVYGAEFAYQQAITENFGLAANYTYADGKQTSNVQGTPVGNTVVYDDRLVGTSKSTYNINGYFENSMFSARVAYNYRSSFYSGLDRSTAFSQAAIGYLSASLGWTINQNFSLTLDGQNLNNPTLKYYALNESQPRAFYVNGRQYYLNLRAKL
jgi:iron complex outermembrane recepter protein